MAEWKRTGTGNYTRGRQRILRKGSRWVHKGVPFCTLREAKAYADGMRVVAPTLPPRRAPPPARREVVQGHLDALRRAGRSREAFDAALRAMRADRRVRNRELYAIAHQYASGPESYPNKTAALDAIRDRFRRSVSMREDFEAAAATAEPDTYNHASSFFGDDFLAAEDRAAFARREDFIHAIIGIATEMHGDGMVPARRTRGGVLSHLQSKLTVPQVREVLRRTGERFAR